MNKQDYDILYTLQKHPFTNQRTLAEQSGYSLGAVNKALKNLSNENYINYECQLTKFAKEDIKRHNFIRLLSAKCRDFLITFLINRFLQKRSYLCHPCSYHFSKYFLNLFHTKI